VRARARTHTHTNTKHEHTMRIFYYWVGRKVMLYFLNRWF